MKIKRYEINRKKGDMKLKLQRIRCNVMENEGQ